MQFIPRADWVAFLKLEAIYLKLVKPVLTANAFNVVDECVPSLDQGFLVAVTVSVVPLMLK